MDMNLSINSKTDDSLVASYSCPCGCNPRLGYHKGSDHATDGCCCGNEFAVGPDAAGRLHAHDGFRQEVQVFQAPWGESLQAAWIIGASVDPDASDHDHDNDIAVDGGHHHRQHAGPVVDPVCGMTVEPEGARSKGLHSSYSATDFFFCGKGCKLEFDEDPERYRDPAYVPTM